MLKEIVKPISGHLQNRRRMKAKTAKVSETFERELRDMQDKMHAVVPAQPVIESN